MTTDPTRRLLDLLRIEAPIVNAPMAGIAGGALAAAVTTAGGLGFVGGGYGGLGWIDEQLALAAGTRVGVGVITWALDDQLLAALVDRGVRDVWLSFGDPAPHLGGLHDAGAIVVCQVQSVGEAVAASTAGADVIVAQGNEAGGHGRDNESVWSLVPVIADAVGPVPVLAAGGIGTAADVQRARRAGAAGVAVGTRFYATHEALDTTAAKLRLVERAGSDTTRTTVFDLVRGPGWPTGYDGRAIVNAMTREWRGREAELRAHLGRERARYARAATIDDLDTRVVWAGAGLDDIDRIESAGDVVRAMAALPPAGMVVTQQCSDDRRLGPLR
jgi:nitronate monooxygenase